MKQQRPRWSGPLGGPPEQGFFGLSRSRIRLGRITLRVQRDGRRVTVTVTADGDEKTVSHAGAALLGEIADRVGLTGALSGGLVGLRVRRGGHDPGRVVRDLAVMLADGGDALCDLRALRDQPALFGRVAADSTAWRVIDDVCEVGLLDALRAARATARERAFELGARPAGPLGTDIDATLITAHSKKEGAGGTYEGGFGFYPLPAYLDCPDGEAGGCRWRGGCGPATRAQTTPAITSPCPPTRWSNSVQNLLAGVRAKLGLSRRAELAGSAAEHAL